MGSLRILVVFGTRPEIIKMAPVVKALRRRGDAETILVHTGQHYHPSMSAAFIRTLGLPEPDFDLHTGSGSHAEQTAHMLLGYEETLRKVRPDLVLAQGDTNSVLAAGLATIKLHIPFGHVEAGLRSFDRAMPEEINRVLADDCSQLCLAPTVQASLNLLNEGIHPRRIFLTGNTIVDACAEHLPIALKASTLLRDLGLDQGQPLAAMTLHRAENTDEPEKLHRIVKALETMEGLTVVFPVHPRARAALEAQNLWDKLQALSHVRPIEPLTYLDFLSLLWHSRLVLTDSGGVQEEALTLGVPCITLRENTERQETVERGDNTLAGTRVEAILELVRNILASPPPNRGLFLEGNPLGDGRAGERIAAISVDQGPRGFDPSAHQAPSGGPPAREEVSFPVGIHGDRVSAIRALYPQSLITAIVDDHGCRLVPYHDLAVREDWTVVMLAVQEDLKRLSVISNFVAGV